MPKKTRRVAFFKNSSFLLFPGAFSCFTYLCPFETICVQVYWHLQLSKSGSVYALKCKNKTPRMVCAQAIQARCNLCTDQHEQHGYGKPETLTSSTAGNNYDIMKSQKLQCRMSSWNTTLLHASNSSWHPFSTPLLLLRWCTAVSSHLQASRCYSCPCIASASLLWLLVLLTKTHILPRTILHESTRHPGFVGHLQTHSVRYP